MSQSQSGILAPAPLHARHLFFDGHVHLDPRATLQAFSTLVDGDKWVVGLGQSLIQALGHDIPGLKVFPQYAKAGIDVPATPTALWLWLRGHDRGELLHQTRQLEALLQPAFTLRQTVEAFHYQTGHDLTGYEDGTENPVDEAAQDAALVAGQGLGYDGASFAAVQQWVHDFKTFDSMSSTEQDHAIGRRKSDNEELADAPPSAHVKRTAQESFEPAAFMLRRSMPWAEGQQGGLLFLAFGHSLAAFEAQLHRMVGAEDGISDGLFQFTRPISGAYFWCPPMGPKGLDLSRLGI